MLIKTNYFKVSNMKKIFLLPPQGNANWFQCISTFQGDYNYVPMKEFGRMNCHRTRIFTVSSYTYTEKLKSSFLRLPLLYS